MSLGHSELGGSELSGGSADRALNDVSLTIGFAMLVMVFVLVPYLAVVQRIAVELPAVERARSQADAAPDTTTQLPVWLVETEAGPAVRLSGGETATPPHLVDAVLKSRPDLAEADRIRVTLHADRRLAYQHVVETLDHLNGLASRARAAVDFELTYTENGD